MNILSRREALRSIGGSASSGARRVYRRAVARPFGRAPFRSIKEFTVYYAGGLYQRTDEHHLFLMGGGLAFSLFVCIVPFVLIVFAVLGKVLEVSSLENQVRVLMDTIIPYPAQADFVKGIIFARTREIVLYKGMYGIVGAVGLLFTASGLFSSMRTILNMTYKATPLKLDLWGKLRDFGMVFWSCSYCSSPLSLCRSWRC